MIDRRILSGLAASVMLSCLAMVSTSLAEEEELAPPPQKITLAGGKFRLMVPGDWKKKRPRSSILQYEFEAPAKEEAGTGGRLTIMRAGGSVDANIERWIGQFAQPDGKPTKERAKVDKKEIAGQQVHIVDLSGTFKDQAGPFAPAKLREKYRMLGAIIVTKGLGTHFIKFTGPQEVLAKHEKGFQKMIQSLAAE